MNISAVVLTKNSERTITKCLESISWCNEIIVIDDNSIDKTVNIVKKYNVKVYVRSLNSDFSEQRNFGLEKARCEWVLFVDSDEIVSSFLKKEIDECTNNPINKYNGYFIKRTDTIWGRKLKYGETGDIWILRLGKKNAGRWVGRVHEMWKIKGNTGRLNNTLNHIPHPTVSDFLSKVNFYSSIRAEELFKNNAKVSWLDIILYPKIKFWVNYIFKLGFLDGTAGFVIAIMMSFHSFLVRGKLWQLQNSHQ